MSIPGRFNVLFVQNHGNFRWFKYVWMGYNRIQQPQLFTAGFRASKIPKSPAPLRLPGFPTNRYVVSWWPWCKNCWECTQECKNTKCQWLWFSSHWNPPYFCYVSWKPCRTIPRDVQKDCPASKVLLKVSSAEKSRLTEQGLAKSFSGKAVSVSKHIPTSGYGSIPIDTFLVGWTSIYQLFWGSLGTWVLTHPHIPTSL